jgi:hypothetical protein
MVVLCMVPTAGPSAGGLGCHRWAGGGGRGLGRAAGSGVLTLGVQRLLLQRLHLQANHVSTAATLA